MLTLTRAAAALFFPALLISHAAQAQNFPGPQPYQQQQMQQQQQPAGGLSLIGAWSWQTPDGNGGVGRDTVLFQQDGSFIHAGQTADGKLFRYWGQYQAQQAGPNQIQFQSHVQAWLPQSVCTQAPNMPMSCVSTPRPPDETTAVTFLSASSFTVEGMTLSRDPQPYLLQQNVPAQIVTMQAPVPVPMPVPPSPYNGGGGYHTDIPGLGGNCDDLQQQRICTINNGHIITSGGCMKCISPD